MGHGSQLLNDQVEDKTDVSSGEKKRAHVFSEEPRRPAGNITKLLSDFCLTPAVTPRAERE